MKPNWFIWARVSLFITFVNIVCKSPVEFRQVSAIVVDWGTRCVSVQYVSSGIRGVCERGGGWVRKTKFGNQSWNKQTSLMNKGTVNLSRAHTPLLALKRKNPFHSADSFCVWKLASELKAVVRHHKIVRRIFNKILACLKIRVPFLKQNWFFRHACAHWKNAS